MGRSISYLFVLLVTLSFACKTPIESNQVLDLSTDIGAAGSNRTTLYYMDGEGDQRFVVRAYCPPNTIDATRANCRQSSQRVPAEGLTTRLRTVAGASVPKTAQQLEDTLTAAVKIDMRLLEMSQEDTGNAERGFDSVPAIVDLESELADVRTSHDLLNDEIIAIEQRLTSEPDVSLEAQLVDMYGQRNQLLVTIKDTRQQLGQLRKQHLSSLGDPATAQANGLLSSRSRLIEQEFPLLERRLKIAMREQDRVNELMAMIEEEFVWPVNSANQDFEEFRALTEKLHFVFASLLSSDARLTFDSMFLDLDLVQELASIPLAGRVNRLAISGQYLVAYGVPNDGAPHRYPNLQLFDISNPRSPVSLAHAQVLIHACNFSDAIYCIVSDQFEEREFAGLRLEKIEVSDQGFRRQTLADLGDDRGRIYSMVRKGHYLIINQHVLSLIFDLSTNEMTTHPELQYFRAKDAVVIGDIMFSIYHLDLLTITLNGGQMEIVNNLHFNRDSGNFLNSIYGVGDTLYLSSEGALRAVDVSSPNDPRVASSFGPGFYDSPQFLRIGDRLVVNGQKIGIYDVTDAQSPTFLRSLGDGAEGIAATKQHLFAISGAQLKIFGIAE